MKAGPLTERAHLECVVPVPAMALSDAEDAYVDEARALVREQLAARCAAESRVVVGEWRERWMSTEAFLNEKHDVPQGMFDGIEAVYVVEVETCPS